VQYTLGMMGPAAKPAMSELIRSLESKDEMVRNSAVFALAKIGPDAKPAGRALVKIMEDETQDAHARAVSGWALLEITDNDPRIAKSVAPMMIMALGHDNPTVRAEAARTLGNLGEHGKPALEKLKQLADDPDEDVRAAAKDAVDKLQ
jgi:HEAT repeat protein